LSSGKPAGRGHTRKHTATAKHTSGKGKHHPSKQKKPHHRTQPAKVHTVAAGQGQHARRGLTTTAGGLECCAAEAVAASLRLTGRPVTAADVAGLYGRVSDATDAGASILATLEAAATWGLGGARPAGWMPAGAGAGTVLLGVDTPGPHTIAVAPCGCWLSWGHAWEPWDATVEEAWEITWPS
jgi:hypothetical protein